jgi:hypothetical protein
MQRAKVLPIGARFGRLTVLRRDGHIHRAAAWLCACDCGGTARVRYTSLQRGEIVSCGCKKREALDRRTHGMKNTPTWKSWDSAIQRTTNPNHSSFGDYGGRGIKVCHRWRNSFEAFLADMGERPTRAHSLDRFPDVNGHYEPGNCRWATWTEQANNRRNTVHVTIGDRTHTLREWADEAGISYGCISQRYLAGRTGTALLAPASRSTRVLRRAD